MEAGGGGNEEDRSTRQRTAEGQSLALPSLPFDSGLHPQGLRCTLTRCPRIFANIQPPAGSQPVSPCETAKIVTLSERRDTATRKTIHFGAQRGRRDAEKYRLKEAQQLMDDFEKAKGRAATSIEELTEWAAERKGGS